MQKFYRDTENSNRERYAKGHPVFQKRGTKFHTGGLWKSVQFSYNGGNFWWRMEMKSKNAHHSCKGKKKSLRKGDVNSFIIPINKKCVRRGTSTLRPQWYISTTVKLSQCELIKNLATILYTTITCTRQCSELVYIGKPTLLLSTKNCTLRSYTLLCSG